MNNDEVLNRQNNLAPFDYMSDGVYNIQYKIINYNLDNPFRSVDVHATLEEIELLANHGFLVKRQIINSETVKVLKSAVDELVDIEMKNPEREYYPGNGIFIRYLIDKNPIFFNLLNYQPILGIIRAALGPQIQLMDMVARVSFLDEPELKLMWHIHNRVIPNPLPPFFAFPHGLDALIYLDDINENNGPICVLPGSHKQYHMDLDFRDHQDKEGQVPVIAKAGDCVFSHSNIWHRVLPSKGKGQQGERRRVLLLGFMPAWFKREFPKGILPKIKTTEILKNNGDSDTKELLGNFEWI